MQQQLGAAQALQAALAGWGGAQAQAQAQAQVQAQAQAHAQAQAQAQVQAQAQAQAQVQAQAQAQAAQAHLWAQMAGSPAGRSPGCRARRRDWTSASTRCGTSG